MNAAVALALDLEQAHKTSLTMSEDVTMSMLRQDTATLPTATTAPARTGTVAASTAWTQSLVTWNTMESTFIFSITIDDSFDSKPLVSFYTP
jgi:hypothetical protein